MPQVISAIRRCVAGDDGFEVSFSGSYFSNRGMVGQLVGVLAVALLLGLHLLAKPGGEAVVTTPDGETVLSLNRPGTYAFAGKDGLTVQLAVEEGRIRFLSSGCPDKVCVRSGWLSRTGQTAACLPAGVVVRVQAADDAGSAVDMVAG